MEKQEILNNVIKIAREVFESSDIQLSEQTSPNDIMKWDSLNHAIFISKIESHFQIKFDLMDMMNFESIGDICEGVQQKLDA